MKDRSAMTAKDRYTCALLLGSHDYLATSAEVFAATLFDVRHSSRYVRSDKQLHPHACETMRGGVDFLFSFLSPVILGSELLQGVRRAAVNFHPAPPEHPGVGSASYALFQGDATFGATAHVMAERVDSGVILRTARFPILGDDTCETLFLRAQDHCLFLLYNVLPELAQLGSAVGCGETWKRKPTSRKQFEQWMKLSASDSPEDIQRKVRALRHSRFPGPFMEVAGYRFELPPRTRAG